MNRSPLLAIHCLTYNQEPFIRDCLEGFVMQKTNFPFVAIVHDDASTDHTADIVREYAEKYPDIIKPIYETENQYSKRDRSLSRIMNEAIAATGCKYIAMCEGDDYWIDPLKLQKQVDFLEENEDYAICFHNMKIWDNNEQTFIEDDLAVTSARTFTINDLAKERNFLRTASTMYRYDKTVHNALLSLPPLPVGDYVWHLLYSETGKLMQLPDVMGVYRLGVGVWSTINHDYALQQYKHTIVLNGLLHYFKHNPEVTDLLLGQMQKSVNLIKHAHDLHKQNFLDVVHSKSYQLGYALLHPFQFIKNKIGRG